MDVIVMGPDEALLLRATQVCHVAARVNTKAACVYGLYLAVGTFLRKASHQGKQKAISIAFILAHMVLKSNSLLLKSDSQLLLLLWISCICTVWHVA